MTTRLCKYHPDFHLPADVVVGEGFDGPAYVGRLRACGVDTVAFFAKCHYGHAYYPSRYGTVHPGLRRDMLAEMVAGCRAHGVGLVVYFSVFLDTAAVRAHPGWAMRPTVEGTAAGFDSGNFRAVCVNSPYLEELFLPQAVEVAERYPCEEMLFDTMTGFQPCHCDHCRARFGRDVPAGPGDPAWLEYVRWYAGCYEEFFARTARVLAALRPELVVRFNWAWSWRLPLPPPPGIGGLTADLVPSGHVASTVARYSAGTGLPHEYMCGRFLHGLGDWNNASAETLQYVAAATVANGGSFYLIDRQLPDGSLEERAYPLIRDVFGPVQERRAVLAGAVPVAETAVLFSARHLLGDDWRYFPDMEARRRRADPWEGAGRLLQERGRHYTAVGDATLAARLADYRLVILPEVEFAGPELVDRLDAFVRAGGAVLLTQSEERLEEGLLELAGVEAEGWAPLDYGYFPWGPHEPVLARGRFCRVRPREGTEELLPAVAPLAAGEGGKKFGHGFAPPGGPAGFPLVTLRRHGRGLVAWVGMPALRWYWRFQNPAVGALLLSLVDRLLPEPVLRISTPAQVEGSAMRVGDDLVVHLVNHSGKERLGGHWYPMTEYVPEIRDIGVSVRLPAPDREVEVLEAPSGTPVPARLGDRRADFVSPPLRFLRSFRLPGWFAAAGG